MLAESRQHFIVELVEGRVVGHAGIQFQSLARQRLLHRRAIGFDFAQRLRRFLELLDQILGALLDLRELLLGGLPITRAAGHDHGGFRPRALIRGRLAGLQRVALLANLFELFLHARLFRLHGGALRGELLKLQDELRVLRAATAAARGLSKRRQGADAGQHRGGQHEHT